MEEYYLLIAIGAIAFFTVISLFNRFRKCPSDKVMVVYGKVGKTGDGIVKSAKCIHGGGTFVWPVIQQYDYLDLTPQSIKINLKDALSKQNIRIDVPSKFTVGISTDPSVMQNAAERLLGLPLKEVRQLAQDIIVGQLRLVVATMDIEEINSDRDKFLNNITNNVEAELKKIGLRLINVNVTDIRDESGYIEALGQEAAAKAVNDAKRKVAERDREGSIGEANAQKDERIKVASANATAVEGENESKIKVANSEAKRREKEAEANRRAEAAEKIQSAKALEESYVAEELAETARAKREKATKRADVLVKAEVEKEKMEVDASAEAERNRIEAEGEADAIFAKEEAKARGIKEVLTRQAEGFEKIVAAADSNPEKAVMMMIADKMPELARIQVEAIKGIDIDKITVWDNGGGQKDGQTTTANFLSGMLKSVPPMEDVFKQAGMELPSYLGSKADTESESETTSTTEE